jgi:hypothetical protein
MIDRYKDVDVIGGIRIGVIYIHTSYIELLIYAGTLQLLLLWSYRRGDIYTCIDR